MSAANEGLPLEPSPRRLSQDLDPFDLICHVAFDQPPLTRRERAESVRKREIFYQIRAASARRAGGIADQVPRRGCPPSGRSSRSPDSPFDQLGTPMQLIKQFGTRADFEHAVHQLQTALYWKVA